MAQDDYDDNINWDDIPDSFEVLPGTYLLKLEDIERREKRDGSGEYVNATWGILDSADSSTERSIGAHVYDNFSLTDKALWKLKATAKAIDPDLVSGSTSLDAVVEGMKNGMIVANVVEETYQGNKQMRVKQVKGAEGWDGISFRVERGQLIGEDAEDAGSNGKSKTESKGSGKGKGKHTTTRAKSQSEEDEVEL